LRIRYAIGRWLKPGEVSTTGAYAILSGRDNQILRASLCHETAHFLAEGPDRLIAELKIV
jgi:hypothetical protein